MDSFIIPGYVENLISTIESAGFEAWLVGGCVRDMLRGAVAHDYDVATSAPCEEVRRLFPRVIDTGIRHGTVTVVLDSNVEVTRYRVDGGYADHRRPESVNFTPDFREDLKRRDFTINAMGYHPERGLFDPFGGRKDLSLGVIRAVGDARERFDEDALRIMRAVRFASTLGFSPDGSVAAAVSEMAPLLKSISAERIFYELWRTLGGGNPSLLSLIIDGGGLNHAGLSGGADLSPLDRIPPDEYVRMAVLCRLCGADAGDVMCRLKSDRERRSAVCALAAQIFAVPQSKPDIKRLLQKIGPEHCAALLAAQSVLFGGDAAPAIQQLDQIIANREPYSVAELKISGDDLILLGISGREVGRILSQLCEAVIGGGLENSRSALMRAAKNIINRR